MTDCDLKNISFFKGFDSVSLKKITSDAQRQHHKKGKILFLHGDEATRFYIIKNGWVKLFRETLDGAQAVIDILTTDHIFGETALFEHDTYPYSAEIVESAEIISLPLSELKHLMEKNHDIALNMLRSMAKHRQMQDQELEHRSIQNAAQRIGCFLLRLTQKGETETTSIHLPYDKVLIASRLGMQPETFSRGLAKLRKNADIDVHGATINIDSIQKLSQYCCPACSSEFPCSDL